MGGLGASSGGEAGRGSAAARADCGMHASGAGRVGAEHALRQRQILRTTSPFFPELCRVWIFRLRYCA